MGRLHGVPGALEAVAALWDRYFPKEVLNPLDSRLDSVSILMDMFDGDLEFILGTIDSRRGLLPLTMPYILSRVPFDDFAGVLIGQPCEVLGCMVRYMYSSALCSLFVLMPPRVVHRAWLQACCW